MPHRARLTVDLAALDRNFRTLCDAASGAETAPVVKADGYGLGAIRVARSLWDAGARSFFVARLDEGEALRRGLGALRPARIFVLDGLVPGTADRVRRSGLIPMLADPAQVEAARSAGSGFPVGLHVDTGMNRQGLSADALAGLAGKGGDGLEPVLLMSHLGSAAVPGDPRNDLQLERFRAARSLFPDLPASLGASAGLFLGPEWRFDMVRPGVSLFGGGPFERPDPRIEAVATLDAPILYVRNVQAGEWLGYGSGLRLDRPARIAVAAAGYADGLLRRGGGRSSAWFAGALRPVLIVNMDLIAIEIGDAPARPGDRVELMGPNLPLDDLAAATDTVAHECLVRLSGRARRRYVRS
jgi:alanine racemase